MMNKIRFNNERFNKDMKIVFTVLTVVTNCFIISGVIHHWKPKAKPIYNYTNEFNTQLAEAQQQITQIQKETTYGTGCTQAYQNIN